MSPREVYANPLVKTVFFEVRFSNLFFLESRIGDFQVKVMKDFPQSDLVHRREITMVAGDLENPQVKEFAKQQSSHSVDKVWQFKAESGPRLEISSKNLVFTSEAHTSYREGGEKSLRPIIEKAVSVFLEVVPIPVVQRVGLRYINHCPIRERTTEFFLAWYDSILPVGKFRLENLQNGDCAIISKQDGTQIRRAESLQLAGPEDHLILDLDASKEGVPSDRILETADALHDVIDREFTGMIKEPVREYMRLPKGGR
jgi:uncharacterized protein (TIGR04255 family)